MRHMARNATLCLDWLMLKDERTLLIDMACEADSVSCCRRPKLFPNESTMGIVAICALHQSLFHPMMEGHIELRLHFYVAAVTEIRLSFGK